MYSATVIKSKRDLDDVKNIEHTVGIIKPEGMKHAKKILETTRKKGFTILKVILICLTFMH